MAAEASDIAEGLKQGAGQASFNDGQSCAGTLLKTPMC
jgi:hypothetical protein